MTNAEKARQYVADVRAGRIPACRWVRAACERHANDLVKSKRRDYRWTYNEEKAERPCRVIELLPHTKGRWAAKHELIALEPWQAFILCSVFGWVDKKTGLRRFREVLVIVPRKNGKSALSAGVGIYMLAFDGEFGAEVFANATSEKQAWEVFRPAKLMVESTPDLKAAKGIVANASNLSVPATHSKFEPVIGKPGDGSSPSLAIIDEYHEHQTPDAHDTMQTGMGAREQPLLWVITTAGDNISGPCYAKQLALQDVLSGAVEDDRTFGIIYTIDPGDDWTDPAVLRKANPNFDVSVDGEYLQNQQIAAIRNPRDQARFKTKHLNIWVNSRDAYFNEQAWLTCPKAPPFEEMRGMSAYLALDLASKTDIAALEILVPLPDGQYARYGKSYLPESTVEDPANSHYAAWRDKGYITVTNGNIIDFARIEEDIEELAAFLRIEDIAYDPFQGTYLATRLLDKRLPVTEYRQTVETMSDPMKSLDSFILSGRLHHNCAEDHPMTWQMGNVVSKTDRKDNVYPTKERAEKKIDNPVALIMAVGRMLQTDTTESPYEKRGILVI